MGISPESEDKSEFTFPAWILLPNIATAGNDSKGLWHKLLPETISRLSSKRSRAILMLSNFY